MADRTTPKRKRQPSLVTTIDNIIDQTTRDALLEPESPRSRMADNLCQMRLHDHDESSLLSHHGGQHVLHVSKKRQFGEDGEMVRAIVTPPKDRDSCLIVTPSRDRDNCLIVTPDKDQDDSSLDDMQRRSLEIEETPGAYMSFNNRLPSSPPISPTHSPSPTQQNHRRCFSKPSVTPITAAPPPTPLTSPGLNDPDQGPIIAKATERMLSMPTLPLTDTQPSPPYRISPTKKRRTSPPPSPSAAAINQSSSHHHQSSSQSSVSSTSSTSTVDRAALTWQMDEITGHLWQPQNRPQDSRGIDGAHDDDSDDGEGVNGIGFRPTAAVEWKRKQGRRRQVSEWKAREANEERRRRAERRKRESGGIALGGGSGNGGEDMNMGGRKNARVKARVRFAET